MPIIDLPSDWLTRLADWAKDVLPLSQLAAVGFTALAAFAAWRSSSAARATAKRADETARRSAEALGRAMQPTFFLMFSSPQEALRSREPVEVTAKVLGTSPHPARDVSIRLERTDGQPNPVIADCPAWVAPNRAGWTIFPLGLVPRRIPEPDLNAAGTPSELIFRFALRFSDQSRLVTWEQYGDVYEMYDVRPISPAEGAPVAARYGYDVRNTRPPVVVSTTDNPPRPVGLIRRNMLKFWRWIW